MPLNITHPSNYFSGASAHADACIYIARPSRLKLRRSKRCRIGHAVLLKKTDECAPRIIAAFAPLYLGGLFREEQTLRACCVRALEIAKQQSFESVTVYAFTRGIFAFPAEKARSLLISVIGDWLAKNDSDLNVTLLSDCQMFRGETASKLRLYIDNRRPHVVLYNMQCPDTSHPPSFLSVNPRSDTSRSMDSNASACKSETDWTEYDFGNFESMCDSDAYGDSFAPSFMPPIRKKRSLEDLLGEAHESFSQMLFRLIDQRGMTDPEVYKRANMDRRLFSKIRSNPDYQPAKGTVLSLAIALELNLDQTTDLLRRAGFALSPSSKSDLIVEFFIRENHFNIHDINEALFAFKQKLLGA